MPSGQGLGESPPHVRIGLFGPYSSRNLGDTATQMAVIDNLRRRCVSVEFIGICAEPIDAVHTYRIAGADMSGASSQVLLPDTPVPRGTAASSDRGGLLKRFRRILPEFVFRPLERLVRLYNIFRLVGRIDVLLISGGGQIDDFWGGPWGRPYELLAWCLACRARNRKVAVFGTGLDNLTSRLGTFMAFCAMRLAHYRMFRDQETLDVLRGAGMGKPSRVAPDPAFSLVTDPSWGSRRAAGPPIVLVCPIAASAWQRVADRPYRNYLDALAETCGRLARAGIEVHLSNTQTSMDAPVVVELAARLRSSGSPKVRLASTVHEYCAIAATANVVVASRLHGVILPIVVGTPVVAIAYMRKVSRLMSDIGMSESCLDVPKLSADRLTELTLEAIARAEVIRARLCEIDRRFRSELAAEFDAVARLASRSL